MANFGKLNFSTSFNPTSAFPLDARCYFDSFEAAQAAAATAENVGSTNTIYHFGMKIIVSENDRETWYEIRRNAEGSGYLAAEGASMGVGQATEDGEIFNDYSFNKAGSFAHAENQMTQALGENSHASGYRTIAGYKNQFVCGQLNDNKEDTLFEVGNGDNVEWPGVQSNAFEVYQDGHAEAITTGESDRSLTTKGYVDNTFITGETLDRRFYEYDLDVQETYATKKEVAEKGSLPPVTSTDNGKLLQVVNGAWAVVEIPFAEGVAV